MFQIPMDPMSREFWPIWSAAGQHLERCADGRPCWLKAHPNPPFREHLSFRVGNQLYFVLVLDADRRIVGPSSVPLLTYAAKQGNGHACVLPLHHRGGRWQPVHPRWGLLDAYTGAPIDPAALVTDEPVVMSQWELQDFGVQLIRDQCEREGMTIHAWFAEPDFDPSINVTDSEGVTSWIIVRASSGVMPAAPANWQEIARTCEPRAARGYFAPMVVAAHGGGEPIRGGPLQVDFPGLQRLV